MSQTKEETTMNTLGTWRLSDYPYQTYDKVRYRDTDRQGHVNNAVFAQFLETGRVEILYNPDHPLHDNGCIFVIVSANTNLISEINWPGIVDIGTGIVSIGQSSIGIVQGLYQHGQCVAISATTIVQMDETTRKSKVLSDSTKARLQELRIEV